MISLIAAMGKNRVIGVGGTLPWKLPADMKRFRWLTAHHPIIMGRKTFESIGKPLPNRTNIVVTRQPEFSALGCIITPSLEAAIEKAVAAPGADEIFIIGGGEIYKQAMNIAGRIYLTVIEKEFEGDAYFPIELIQKPSFVATHQEVRAKTVKPDEGVDSTPRRDERFVAEHNDALAEYGVSGQALDEAKWKLVKTEEGIVNEENIYPHQFLVFERAK